MSESELCCLSHVQVYEWVKTGHWNMKQFTDWYIAVIRQYDSTAFT